MTVAAQLKGKKHAIAKAFAHPLRHRAFHMLTQYQLSPSEIAQQLGADLHSVSYHVRELEKMGLIEQVDERQVRGAVQHFFRAVQRPMISTEEWAELSLVERQEASQYVMQVIIGDAIHADQEGTFDARLDRHLSRTPIVVDEIGWKELHDLHLEALNKIIEVQAKSAERLANAEEPESFPAMAAAICIEMPQS